MSSPPGRPFLSPETRRVRISTTVDVETKRLLDQAAYKASIPTGRVIDYFFDRIGGKPDFVIVTGDDGRDEVRWL